MDFWMIDLIWCVNVLSHLVYCHLAVENVYWKVNYGELFLHKIHERICVMYTP